MDKDKFDSLRIEIESKPEVTSYLKIHEQSPLMASLIGQHPTIQLYANKLKEAENLRVKVIRTVVSVLDIPWAEADSLIADYCNANSLSWDQFYVLFLEGSIALKG